MTREEMGTDPGREMQRGGGAPGAPPVPADGAIGFLVAASGWMRFLAVMGFISVGFLGLAGLVILIVGFPGLFAGGRLIGMLYIVLSAVMLFCVLPLNRAAGAAGALRETHDQAVVVDSLRHQAVFWRRYGIFTIVSIALGILAAFIGPIAMWAGR